MRNPLSKYVGRHDCATILDSSTVLRILFPMVHPCIRVDCRIFKYAAVRMRKPTR